MLIGLISVAILDLPLIVDAAERVTDDDSIAEHRSAGESSVIRLPPDIVIPLPFVYPEYNDPRERVSSAAKIHQTPEESLGDAILENVRNTMLVSSSQEIDVMPLKNVVTDKPFVRKTNRHRSPLVRSESNAETPARPEVKSVTSGEDDAEIERPSERPLKFGSRLRGSHGNSNRQESVRTRNRGDDGVEIDSSVRNGSESMSQSTPDSPRNPASRARGENSVRRNPAASIRRTVPRRGRPKVDSSEDVKSDADVTEPRSLAGRIFRRKIQAKSRPVDNDQE